VREFLTSEILTGSEKLQLVAYRYFSYL